ncbi:MAG: 4-phosphopantoate--beta-alanine ligase [Phycisphaerales bacterium]
MDVVGTVEDLREALGGDSCVLVPTMGALHGGHESLLRLGRAVADDHDLPLAASIFVNPTQFNDPSDLERYPRPLQADLELLLRTGVEIAFVPSAEQIYPPDDPLAAPQPELPAVATEPGLEDQARPGHFAGVCRVVSRLFDLFDPEAAIFGEKDWQQLRVVSAMVATQGRSVEIVPCPTAREPDGLAMSSRNVRLTPETRPKAAALYRGLIAAQNEADPGRAVEALRSAMVAAGIEVEYAAVRDAEMLTRVPPGPVGGPWRVLGAGCLDGVRLLDNAAWPA